MEKLLKLLENPIRGIIVSGNGYSEKFCRTTNRYRPFPKEIKGPDGKETTLYYRSKGIFIYEFNNDTYNIYKEAVENYINLSEDIYKISYGNPRLTEIREPKEEFIDKIKEIDKNRKEFKELIENKRIKYGEEMEALGVELCDDSYFINVWPENCQYKDEWYNIKTINDYKGICICLHMHKETELYRAIFKGIKGERIIDKIRAGNTEKIN